MERELLALIISLLFLFLIGFLVFFKFYRKVKTIKNFPLKGWRVIIFLFGEIFSYVPLGPSIFNTKQSELKKYVKETYPLGYVNIALIIILLAIFIIIVRAIYLMLTD
jgi:hypothetical protein